MTAAQQQKTKAEVNEIIRATLVNDANWSETQKKPAQRVVWRRWAKLKEEPEAYTREDLEKAKRRFE